MRALSVSAALFLIMVLAAPMGAQTSSDMPTELWSEYPLLPKVETTESRTIGPFLPPSDSETVVVPGDSIRWGVWLAVASVGLVALLLAVQSVRPVLVDRARARRATAIFRPPARERKPIPLRPSPRSALRVPAAKPLPQYAPRPVDEPDDLDDEPRRFVMRRTGLVRSRFVVLADDPGGEPSVLASSRSFWRVGDSAWRERAAEDAWDDLMNELRLSGWEQESARRSDYYVSLRRIDLASSSVLPTIEAYTYADEDSEQA
jgi:hypothetical protein